MLPHNEFKKKPAPAQGLTAAGVRDKKMANCELPFSLAII
jgi:hypothetical protein